MSEAILVIGSSNTDMVIQSDRIPSVGETVVGGEFKVFSGGKGANQAVAAARAGGKVTFLGAVGKDSFGREALKGLSKEGIDISMVKKVHGVASGVALIMVDRSGENLITVAPGANAYLEPDDLDRVDFSHYGFVVLQLEIPLKTVVAAIERASSTGCIVILNPAPAVQLPEKVLRLVDFLVPNRRELEILALQSVKSNLDIQIASDRLVKAQKFGDRLFISLCFWFSASFFRFEFASEPSLQISSKRFCSTRAATISATAK